MYHLYGCFQISKLISARLHTLFVNATDAPNSINFTAISVFPLSKAIISGEYVWYNLSGTCTYVQYNYVPAVNVNCGHHAPYKLCANLPLATIIADYLIDTYLRKPVQNEVQLLRHSVITEGFQLEKFIQSPPNLNHRLLITMDDCLN